MARATRMWLTIAASSAVIAIVFAAVWFSGSREFLLERSGRGMLIGLAVGFLAMIVRLGRPAAQALVATTPWTARPYLVPSELPPPPTFFVGREDQLREVTRLIRKPPGFRRGRPFVLVLEGQPGVGKSGFALKAAASVAAGFNDGVIYESMTDARVDSRRLDSVLTDLVDTLQGPRDDVPRTPKGRIKEFRKLSKRKSRVLYLLDDVVDERAVKELMPVSPYAVVLITSRQPLAGLTGATRVRLDPLSIEDSIVLVGSLLGLTRPDTAGRERTRPDGTSPDAPLLDEQTLRAIRRVAVSAAGYPLALHLAARAISIRGLWALSELTEGLPDEPGQITDEMTRERMLDLSVKILTDTQRRTLLSLAWMPHHTFAPWMVQAIAGLPKEEDAWRVCDRLADLRLLERIAPDAAGVVRLRLPDRVNEYISVRVGYEFAEHDRRAALRRLDDAPSQRHPPTAEDVLAWLNRGEVGKALSEARAALADAIGDADPLGPTRLLEEGSAGRDALAVLAEVLAELGGLDDAVEIATAQERIRRERGQRRRPRDAAEVRLRRSLGRLLRRAGKLDKSIVELDAARALAVELDDAEQQILALRELAIAQSMRHGDGRGFRQANKTLEHAAEALDRAGETTISLEQARLLECRLVEAGVIVLLNGKGGDRATNEPLQAALDELDRALKLMPDAFTLWRAWLNYQRARVLIRLAGDAAARASAAMEAPDGEIVSGLELARRLRPEARRVAEDALRDFAEMSHRYGTARCRLEIGRVYALERAEAAVPVLEEARETFFFSSDRWIEARTALELAAIRAHIGHSRTTAKAELDFATKVFTLVRDRDNLREVARVRKLLQAGKK